MQKTIRSDMIRSNVILILLVTVCLSGLHLYQIYRYTILQNQEEIIKMSEQARNSLNNMLNQLDVLQYQIVDSLTQSEEYDRIRPVWTKEGLTFQKHGEPVSDVSAGPFLLSPISTGWIIMTGFIQRILM